MDLRFQTRLGPLGKRMAHRFQWIVIMIVLIINMQSTLNSSFLLNKILSSFRHSIRDDPNFISFALIFCSRNSFFSEMLYISFDCFLLSSIYVKFVVLTKTCEKSFGYSCSSIWPKFKYIYFQNSKSVSQHYFQKLLMKGRRIVQKSRQ